MSKNDGWIFRRLHELELASEGYRFLLRTMTDEDWKGFNKMIDMPGFSKEKFEEDFLLKKINPFSSKESIVNSDEQEKTKDLRAMTNMRDQLEDFLERWEDFFDDIVLSIISVTNSSQVLNKLGVLRVSKRRKLGESSEKSYLQDDDSYYQQPAEQSMPKSDTDQKKPTQTLSENAVERQSQNKEEDDSYQKDNVNTESQHSDAIGNTPSLLNPSFDNSVLSMETARSAETPDSGVITDVSEIKTVHVEKKNKKSDNPEQWTGRDGRRYRKEKEKAAKFADEQLNTENQNEIEEENNRDSVPSGKQKRRLKDRIRKERQIEELQRSNSLLPEISENPALNEIECVPELDEKKNIDASNAANTDTILQSLPVKVDGEQCSTVYEEPKTKKTGGLSKSQKRRARMRAQKGVYVVNDTQKMAHTVELSPGEYKIVKVDRQQVSDDAPWDSLTRNTELEKAIMKMQNCYISDGVSKNVLDEGKWLAYVIDDKNPDNPKIGEVSNDEINEIKAHLESKLKRSEEQQAAEDLIALANGPILNSTSVNTLPMLDADSIRKILTDIDKNDKRAEHDVQGFSDGGSDDGSLDDLDSFLNNENSDVINFRTEFAERTASLFVRNAQFIEFCRKYVTSKYSTDQIHKLITRIIDSRILSHYEMFQLQADQESHRIAQCWTHINESSPYAMMVMMFVNSTTSNVNFRELENVLFPHPNPVYLN